MGHAQPQHVSVRVDQPGEDEAPLDVRLAAAIVLGAGDEPERLGRAGMIEEAADRSKAVVIGGGLLGLEAANGLKLRGMNVTVVHLMDWLMANQLTKSKKTLTLLESWENSPSSLQRRAYWYYQGRLRWTGQKPPENTEDLLKAIEANIAKEEAEVQWAMNFTAGWIGVYDERYRKRCIGIGMKSGLYKDQKVSKGCTPNYLPEFIAIEVGKRNK